METSNGNPALHETFRNRLVYTQRFLKMSVVTLLLSPSLGRGTPEGQGVGRRRNRAKPTSGATRHLLPKEGGRNRSKCIDLYTSSLKAGYSYSLFMNLHNLILRLNQRFLNTRRFSPLRVTKCALPLPLSPLKPVEPAPPSLANNQGAARPLGLTLNLFSQSNRRCEITIISFSRSICCGGLAALIGVTGKPYPSCLSYHSHPIRPFRAPSPRGAMLLS